MWNYTVERAAMNLQRCQFQTRNMQSGEVLLEAVPFEKPMSESESREKNKHSKKGLKAVFSSQN